MKKKCCFDHDGVCMALACYSSEKCGSRDENGNPIYADTEKVLRKRSNCHKEGKK